MQMKIFSFTLAVYIALLIAMPCVDGLAGSHDNATSVSVAGENFHHHEGDFCSPFCTCNCCSTHTISSEYFILLNTTSLGHPVIPAATMPAVQPPVFSVWQPPEQA
jgi:hypothetical protein